MQKLLLLLVLTMFGSMAAFGNSNQEENLREVNAVNNNESGKSKIADVTQIDKGKSKATDAEEPGLRASKRLNRQFRSKRPYINYQFD